MVFENKDLYPVEHFSPELDHFDITFSKNNNVVLKSKYGKSKVSILTFGFATSIALTAANTLIQEYEMFTNLIIPQIVSPLNLDFAVSILKNSEVLYLVEEGDGASGLSGLLLQELQRLNLTPEVKLISGKGMIGASKISEAAALISPEKIVNTLIKNQ
jgi:pyruvate/2-oxoglutarate/acetoin dehydrogenase E1 component